jgi:hypothetical protein
MPSLRKSRLLQHPWLEGLRRRWPLQKSVAEFEGDFWLCPRLDHRPGPRRTGRAVAGRRRRQGVQREAQLKKAIAALDAGDVVLTPIDRLARSTRDPLNIFESGPEQVFDLWKYRALHGQPHKI